MKVTDKLTTVDSSFIINMYDNGFMVEVGGNNQDNNWTNAKIMVSTVDDLIKIVREVAEMKRES